MAKTIEEQQKTNKFHKTIVIFGWIAMMIFAFHASTHMVGAGDTWVALACGRHFVEHGVDTVEPFSANSHDAGPTAEEVENWPDPAQKLVDIVGLETFKKIHPTGWVNQNWLTHVIFYWLSHLSPLADAQELSFNTLVYWKFALYITSVIAVYYIGRLLGVHAGLSALFACFALFAGRSFLDIRPAGFSNLMVPLYFLSLILATYKNYKYIWLIVPIAIFWNNLHGGYIYLFIMLVPFFGLNLLSYFLPDRFVSIGKKGLIHTAGAGAAALLGSIIFNPFHLTNITHTFIISISEHAERWRDVNEWNPAYDFDNPVGDEIPYFVMMGIGLAVLVSYYIASFIRSSSFNKAGKRRLKVKEEYTEPRIDLALIAIGLLTCYMALKSRRFIPIAAFIFCPMIAKLVQETANSVSAWVNLVKERKYVISKPSKGLQAVMAGFAVTACLFFGTWWGYKYYRIYLAPWPTDPNLNSVFMRMTASDAKPFYACQFIRENKLEGNMFNYWTEGGFIAWGQEPDPETGKTPLQLFMDGRAQAAYDVKTFDLWSYLMQGGPTVRKVMTRGQKLGIKDYHEIGQWFSRKLREFGVWVVMMPKGQFDLPILKGLDFNPEWKLVFFNNKQKIFVDTNTDAGKKLYEGIPDGKTKYPSKFSRNVVMSYNLLQMNEPGYVNEGLRYAIKAFEEYPSQVSANLLVRASRLKSARPQIEDVFKVYLEDFRENYDNYKNQDGLYHRLSGAWKAADFLRAKAGNAEKRMEYNRLIDSYVEELLKLMKDKRW